jgi:hypothetical protein
MHVLVSVGGGKWQGNWVRGWIWLKKCIYLLNNVLLVYRCLMIYEETINVEYVPQIHLNSQVTDFRYTCLSNLPICTYGKYGKRWLAISNIRDSP